MKLLKFNPKKNKAQAIVEFAIALPILLLILYGLMETGRYILIVSFVNNASRQAARYGSTSGVNPVTSVPRYQDCVGIRAAAQKSDFLNTFDDNDIYITYDGGPGTADKIIARCDGSSGATVAAANGDRVKVEIRADFNAVVPKLVPFISRTVAKGNPVTAKSSRTLIVSISIQQTGGGTKEATTVGLVTSPSGSSEIGQTVLVTVTVSGTTTPTGTVAITGADVNCSITLSNGTGSCNVIFNTIVASLPETRTLIATYSGDSSHNASSNTISQNVTKASTSTNITADAPDPSATNAQVAVSVSVTSAWGTPTGTVSITGADTNCTITLPAGSCNVTFTSTGSKVLNATYNGDSSHLLSSDTEAHTVLAANATITTINSSSFTQTLTITFSTTVSGVGATPAGTVVFKEGATTLCTVNLASGTGTCTYTFTTPGAKSITATYSSTNGLTASSATQTLTVGSTTTVITTGTPVNGVVPVIATVTGNGTPTGTVAITGADTNCTITLSGGTGTCNVTFNSSVTNKTLTGTYSGDSSHAASTGTVNVTLTVSSVISCAISSYTVNNWNDGNGGFGGAIQIKNTGSTTINNGWVLTWTFPGTQQVTQMWNPSTYTQSGAVVTATSSTSNGGAAIAPGATFTSMGFNGTKALPYPTNNYPTDFKLNGTSCTPPPVASCSTSTVVVSKMQFVSGKLTLPINNTLPSALLIKDVTVTWYESKGHSTGSDKTLIMQSASIGGVTFWTGSDADGTNSFAPAAPTYIPTGASTMSFAYHQTQDRWDDESITINLATPGCETVVLSAPVGFHQ